MMVGKIFKSRYEVKRVIGDGGMATVYLAFDHFLSRDVALKVLKESTLKDMASMERFKKEVIASTSIHNVNVVEIYDVDCEDGKWFIAMEYVVGQTLKQLIVQEGTLSPKEAIDIMIQLSNAVRAAHGSGVIHRDIKPQNILIRTDGTVKLTDFGIALIFNSATVTKTETIVGSVQYLAPEVLKGEKPSIKSDIYGMGILLYEMLRGDLPFKGDTPISIALEHIGKEIPSLRKYNFDIPQSLENVVIKATAKKQENRFSSALAFSESLRTVFSSERTKELKIQLNEKTRTDMTKVSLDRVIKKSESKKGILIGIIIGAFAVAATFIVMQLLKG